MIKRTQKAYDKWAPAYDTDPNPHILVEHDDVLNLVAPKRHEKFSMLLAEQENIQSNFRKEELMLLALISQKKCWKSLEINTLSI